LSLHNVTAQQVSQIIVVLVKVEVVSGLVVAFETLLEFGSEVGFILMQIYMAYSKPEDIRHHRQGVIARIRTIIVDIDPWRRARLHATELELLKRVCYGQAQVHYVFCRSMNMSLCQVAEIRPRV
jgi:hypothetical protein